MGTQLWNLPPELIIRILSFLDLADLNSCLDVNLLFCTIIKHSVLLQYLIAIEAAGVEDNPNCTLDLATRLRRLNERESAWSRFAPNFQATIDIQYRPSGIYDLTGGIYLLGDGVGQRPVTKGLNYVVLPSTESGPPSEQPEWSRISVGRSIVDIGLALQEHDLIAIVTTRREAPHSTVLIIEIELRNFSTGTPHTMASQPTLHITRSPVVSGRCHVSIEIVGDYLALLLIYMSPLLPTPDHFYLFDWKKGTLEMASDPDHNTYHALIFLSASVLLLPNLQTKCFDFVHIPPFPESSPNPIPLKVAHSLALPRLAPTYWIPAISCRAEPNPVGPNSSIFKPLSDEAYPIPNVQRPFHSSPADAIVLFDIYIRCHDIIQTYSLIIHRRALLALLPPHDATVVQPTPWDQWGPPISRWMNTDEITTRWITTSAGQRYVQLNSDAFHQPSPIVIYDFNPYHVLDHDYDENNYSVKLPHRILGGDAMSPFEEDVWFELPYRVIQSKEMYDFDAVLMDEERIIGMRMDDDLDTVTSIDVLHFG